MVMAKRSKILVNFPQNLRMTDHDDFGVDGFLSPYTFT